MEEKETELQTLARTLERVTKMLTDVVIKQTELNSQQISIFEKGNELINRMYDDFKNK